MNGYLLNYSSQCVEDDAAYIDQNVISGIVAASMLAILAVGGMQMQISPNLWVMINTLQILRTILLLKINIPLGVRQTIEASSLFAQFDFGVTDYVFPEPNESESIMQIMAGDELLGQYFEEYGIETYRFIDYVAAVFFDILIMFVGTTLLVTGLSVAYLKCKKKPLAPIKDKLKHVFLFNGFIR